LKLSIAQGTVNLISCLCVWAPVSWLPTNYRSGSATGMYCE